MVEVWVVSYLLVGAGRGGKGYFARISMKDVLDSSMAANTVEIPV